MVQKILAGLGLLLVAGLVIGSLVTAATETIVDVPAAITLALVVVFVAGLAGATARTRWRHKTPYW